MIISILKLKPSYKHYIWGGTNLKTKFNKECDEDILSESWELSCHNDGPCYVLLSNNKEITLKEYINKKGEEVLGENYKKFNYFPILVKLIDSKENLSIQVHPNDEYAQRYENAYGKTEMWYIIDCKDNSSIYYGFNRNVTKNELRKHIEKDTLLDVLNKVKVKKGDTFFIETGTVHAIGKGITIAEIQQNSNLTYRIHDYNRIDDKGNKRELHLDKAIDVINYRKTNIKEQKEQFVVECKYFKTKKIIVKNEYTDKSDELSFKHLLFIEGNGEIYYNNEKYKYKKGDSFLILANSDIFNITGNSEVLITSI